MQASLLACPFVHLDLATTLWASDHALSVKNSIVFIEERAGAGVSSRGGGTLVGAVASRVKTLMELSVNGLF